MNVILGFGSTETEFEAAEEAAFIERVTQTYAKQTSGYFTDEFVKAVETWVEDRAKELRAVAKSYEKAETFPDRYSYYYPYIAQSASDIVLIANFQHINRRHALSPDGWALMQNKRLFHVSSVELPSPSPVTQNHP
jgi:hypothetical protein